MKSIPTLIKHFDVVILQELFDKDLRNSMIKQMQTEYPFHTTVVGHNTDKALTGGVIIFSKWPIMKEDQIEFQANAGIDGMAAKGVAYAAINKQGKIYHVIGTHMQATIQGDSASIRKKQLLEMVDFINHLKLVKKDPLIIGGDFNIDEFSTEINALLSTLNVDLIPNKGYSYSIDGTIDTMQVAKEQLRIDYVFACNEHEKPIAAYNKVYILRDLDNEVMWPKFDLSDHFPVASYFEFPKEYSPIG